MNETETRQELMTGAQIIVRSLIKQGVDVVFGYPGGQVLDVYDELYKHSEQINHVLSAHEQGATHAADGYARATGKVGVVIATSGPGATNLVTGIATAQLDSIPFVAITGNVATTLLGKDSFQETDIFGITIPVTKHNYIVKNVEDLPKILADAFAIARSGRPGPVLIDVPRDVQTASCLCQLSSPDEGQEDHNKKSGHKEEADGENDAFSPALDEASTSLVSEDAIKEAAELIASSKRPLIYCGGGVLSAAAGPQVMEFAEHIDAAIVCSIMGLTAIPASYSRNLGMTGMHGREAAIRATDSSDLIIAVGARFSDRATGNKAHYTANTKFIHIDIDPAEINKNIIADVALVGDVKDVIRQLFTYTPAAARPEWQHEVNAMRVDTVAHPTPTDRLTAKTVIGAVQQHTDEDTLIVTDVGQHQMWVAQNYRFEKPRTLLTSGGLGTMGYGMGASIGACLGKSIASGSEPKKTVLFTGDGSFGMNLNEMATAVSQNLPLVIVIVNNGVLGMVRQWQTLFYDRRYSNTTLNRATDFIALARAFGADGRRTKNLEELNEALGEAFASPGPYVIDCIIDEEAKVFPMIPPGGTINDMLLG